MKKSFYLIKKSFSMHFFVYPIIRMVATAMGQGWEHKT